MNITELKMPSLIVGSNYTTFVNNKKTMEKIKRSGFGRGLERGRGDQTVDDLEDSETILYDTSMVDVHPYASIKPT